jgi:hypothetical protein
MSSADFFAAGLMLVSLRATAWELERQNSVANVPHRIVRAFCDNLGAHIVYDKGPALVQNAKRGERCTDLKVSDDRRSAGWLMDAQATVEDGDGHVIQRWRQPGLFVNGIQVKDDNATIYEWRFHNRGRQVVFLAGPLTGEANVFLYDVERRQVIDQCLKRQRGTICPEWAK